MKFTFKKWPENTGLARVANPYSGTDIKLKGQRVGFISPPSARSLGGEDFWSVWVRVIDTTGVNPNCNWRNTRFKTEPEARVWIRYNLEAALLKNNLILSPEIN